MQRLKNQHKIEVGRYIETIVKIRFVIYRRYRYYRYPIGALDISLLFDIFDILTVSSETSVISR